MPPRIRLFALFMLLLAMLATTSITCVDFLAALQSGREETLEEEGARARLAALLDEVGVSRVPEWEIMLATRRHDQERSHWYLVRLDPAGASAFYDEMHAAASRRFRIRPEIARATPAAHPPHWWPAQKLSAARIAYVPGAYCCFLFLDSGDIYVCKWAG